MVFDPENSGIKRTTKAHPERERERWSSLAKKATKEELQLWARESEVMRAGRRQPN